MAVAAPIVQPPALESDVRAGGVLPPWQAGVLEIHQISTGRGNAAFVRFPDGTSLLLDAGDGGRVEFADPVPNGTRSAAAWIAQYVRRAFGRAQPRLDYALLTHFHPDHVGALPEVESRLPIGVIIDRGYDYQPPGATDRTFAAYREFVAAGSRAGRFRVAHAQAGRRNQIVALRQGLDTPFAVRIVAASQWVWTGRGDEVVERFPPLAQVPPEDQPTENMCSIAVRISYGAFDFFSGGDTAGYPVPGGPPWHDEETAIARAIGSTDVHVVNHHGSLEEENPEFLRTLRSRVLVIPAWAPTHPSPDVLKRVLSRRIYPEARDVFVTQFRPVTKAATGPRANQVASDHGHVVVRVDPGGSRYRVIVLDDTDPSYRVRSVHGPYASRP